MRGLRPVPAKSTATADEGLPPWESLVIEAAGDVIEYWGFKANQGRIWALLYLHGRPFTAAEIGRALRLSKGAVSMVTREMEQWGVLHRVRGGGARTFVAETDFVSMIGQVVATREASFVARISADLDRAERAARGQAPPEMRERIARVRTLARFVANALSVFIRTARFDATGAMGILTGRRKPAPARETVARPSRRAASRPRKPRGAGE